MVKLYSIQRPKSKKNGIVAKKIREWCNNTRFLFKPNSFRFKLWNEEYIFQRIDWGYLYAYNLTKGVLCTLPLEHVPVICPNDADFVAIGDTFITIDDSIVKCVGLHLNTMIAEDCIEVVDIYDNSNRYLTNVRDFKTRIPTTT